MYSDLMSSSCEEINFEECIFSGYNSLIKKFCFSEFWIRWIYCGHLFTIVWISPYKRFYITTLIFHYSSNKGKIRLMNTSFLYLKLESMHRFIIFCYNNQSTRILVKTMNNTRTLDSIDYGWIEFWILTSYSKTLKMMKERIYKCSRSSSFSGCWMSIDTSIFADNRKVIILIDDIKRHIFPNE